MLEGDGWVDWSELATTLTDLAHSSAERLVRVVRLTQLAEGGIR
jgi:hypothetical protein